MSIFISYSRKDQAFVHRVHEGLVAEGRETWVDWEGIAPSADWMRQIEAAIDAADAVVCVLSPEFVASVVCRREVAHAVKQHKRLIPIVAQDVDAARVDPELGRLNWVNFTTTSGFDHALRTLLSAIDTDLAWVQAHTRLLVRAVEWDTRAREASLALRGADLAAAEQWLALGPGKAPLPTELQTRYIIESRRLATKRRSQLIGAGALALVVIAVVGTLALTQRREASRQEAVASARRLASASERLREQLPTEPSAAGPVERSVQLAAEGLLQLESIGQRSLEADLAMRRALALMPVHVARLVASVEPPYAFEAIAFDAAGRLAAADARLTTTGVWELQGFKPVAGRSGASAGTVTLSADARFVAATNPGDAGGVVEVTEMASGQPVARLANLGVVGEVALAPGARFVAISAEAVAAGKAEGKSDGARTTRLWALPDARLIATLPAAAFLSFSPDGRYLAGAVDDRPTVWAVDRLARGNSAGPAVLAPVGGSVGALLFSPDGTHLAAGHGATNRPGKISVWTVGDWKPVHEIARELLLAVSPGGRYVAVRGDDMGWLTRIVEVATDREVARLNAQSDFPPIAFHPNGREVAIVSGKHVELWRIETRGSEAARIEADERAWLVAFGADEATVTAFVRSADSIHGGLRAQRWALGNGRADSTPALDLGRATGAIAISGDGRWLALADEREARIVDAATGSVRQRINAAQPWTALGLNHDGRFLAGATEGPKRSGGNTVHLWQLDPPQPIGSAPLGGPMGGNFVAVSMDGKSVSVITAATVSRSGQALSVHVFDAPAMTERTAAAVGQKRNGLAAEVCALSSDGRLIAVNTAGSAMAVREAATGREIGIVDEAGSHARCAFSADARLLAATGTGDTVRVWDVAAQAEVARLEGIARSTSMAFSANGRHLATLQRDGTLKVWPLRYADLLADACSRLSANIGPDEWERTMGARPYRAACTARPVPER